VSEKQPSRVSVWYKMVLTKVAVRVYVAKNAIANRFGEKRNT
jgi:hypothetical protein